MKGFYISVSNGLLEPKHVKRMGGGAVFLYMWLLDRMTSISEDGVGLVLGGKPVKSEAIQESLGISDKTYRRWLTSLAKEPDPYIRRTLTPYGYSIEVFKAQKTFGQKVNRSDKSDRPLRKTGRSDVTGQVGRKRPTTPADVTDLPDKFDRPIIDKTVDKTTDKTVDNSTSPKTEVLSPEETRAKGFLDAWNKVHSTGYRAYKPIVKNLIHWLETYSQQEIIQAMVNVKTDQFWKDKMTPTIFLRRKDPRGEEVDRIGELLHNNRRVATQRRNNTIIS